MRYLFDRKLSRVPGSIWILGLVIFGSSVAEAQPVESPKKETPAPVVASPVDPSRPKLTPTNPEAASPDVPAETPVLKSKDEAKKLLQELDRTVRTHFLALKHRFELEADEMNTAHQARKREFEDRERSEKKNFFEKNREGHSRRQYMEDFRQRQKKLFETIQSELVEYQKKYETAVKTERERLAVLRKQFEQYLKEGKRPPDSLWPKNP